MECAVPAAGGGRPIIAADQKVHLGNVGRMRSGLRKVFIAIIYCLGVLVFFEATARGVLWSDRGFRRFVGDQWVPDTQTDDTAWRLSFVRRHSQGKPIYYK